MKTQLELAQQGKISQQIEEVASKEKLKPEIIRKRVALGEIVIANHPKRPQQKIVGIGTGLRTKVNASIGTSSDICDIEMEMRKAKIAEQEGLQEIANRFNNIAKAEEHHKERYQKLLDQINTGTFFKKSEKVWWICRECGYAIFSEQPPEKCPSCDHPKSYYELKCEEY